MPASKITSPDDPALAALCGQLAEMAAELDRGGGWPAEQLRLCGEHGVFEWFVDRAWGGQGWSDDLVVRGYLALSAACLTTSFIITQRTGACRRIAGSMNESLQQRFLPGLLHGETFATVGISHLTTSRRHVGRPVLTAQSIPGGFRLHGTAPWVTGGAAADMLVLAATLVDGDSVTDSQLLAVVPTDRTGLTIAPPVPLVGVSSSSTGPVYLDGVEIRDELLIAGPLPNVMASGVGAGTGGIETSTLAIGLANATIDYLENEAVRRGELGLPAAALRAEHRSLRDDLLEVARGNPSCPKELLRQRANSLALRASQAALAAAKGSGFIVGHPAGRWCREALFFLVWSCPQPVAAANLCELAGIED